jgi:beta-galactosidase
MAVWYGGGKARAPMLEKDARAKKEIWRKDVRQIKSLGFNTIRTWIDWATGEPKQGDYRFENLDVILELAREEGLHVFLQVYMDSAPRWVGTRYPDSLFVSSNGAAVIPESSPGYCIDHPGVRQADLAFYEALAKHVRGNPVFAGWDLWSEPHVINWATPTYIPNPEFCFCKNTLARFRTWLRKKYGAIDRLNEAWYRQFKGWDEVEPGRMSTILSYTDYIDWKTFIADKLGEDLRDRARSVKSAAPETIVTSHAAGVGLFASPNHWEGQSDDWTMARQVDFYGTSFYPKHSTNVDRDVPWRAALLDFTRSFGFADGRGGFYIGELQSGFGTIALNVSPTVTADDLRVWTWSALARGAKGINYYAWYPMSSGYESGGFGMIELDGTVTERARAAGEIARLVDQNQKLFLDAHPPGAQVAVIYNPLVHFLGGRQRATSYGGPQGEVAGIERDSLLGVYRALFPRNVPLDYVHVNDLASLGQYKLVILPYPVMLPEAAAAPLKEYVRDGGALVAEARMGWSNESGQASDRIPGMGLWEVMGCRETAVQTGERGRTTIEWLANGDRIPARWYEETLEPVSEHAKVVAKFADGRAAAVESAFGKGRTLTIGSYVSAAYESTPSRETERFYAGLLDWAGVELPVTVSDGKIEVRMLKSGAHQLLFVFNHEKHSVDAVVTVKGGEPLRKRMEANEVWFVR